MIRYKPFLDAFRVVAAGGKLEDSGGNGSFHKNSHTSGASDSGSGRSLLTLSNAEISPSDCFLGELFLLDDDISHGGEIPPWTQNTFQ